MPEIDPHTRKTLVLASTDISKIVQYVGLDAIMDKLIARMSTAFETFNPEETIIPVRSGFSYERPQSGLIEWMPLYNKGKEIIIKIVGYHPDSPANFNLPSVISTISSYDTSTGHLIGIMDGESQKYNTWAGWLWCSSRHTTPCTFPCF